MMRAAVLGPPSPRGFCGYGAFVVFRGSLWAVGLAAGDGDAAGPPGGRETFHRWDGMGGLNATTGFLDGSCSGSRREA
jgi:hypothetical protein